MILVVTLYSGFTVKINSNGDQMQFYIHDFDMNIFSLPVHLKIRTKIFYKAKLPAKRLTPS